MPNPAIEWSMPTGIPRPSTDPTQVARAYSQTYEELFHAWLGDEVDGEDYPVAAIVENALRNGVTDELQLSLFMAAPHDLTDVLDAELVVSLYGVRRNMEAVREALDHSWVMMNQIRVPVGEGDTVWFAIEDGSVLSSEVLAVKDRNARILVQRKYNFGRREHIWIALEQVRRYRHESKSRKPYTSPPKGAA